MTAVKTLLGRFTFLGGLNQLLLRNAAVVVVFHRVQDEFDPTGLSVSTAAFADHCAFFKRHFRVASLSEIVDRLHRGDRVDRHLAITFDDGYRDNFVNAAPVLERLGLPATFFIVSEWIGSSVVPWWDGRHGLRYPWMTRHEVRALHRRGFDIGAHTRTHVDLGTVDPATAGVEIAGGRADLEDLLSARVDLFACPYGRPANIAERNRDLVRAAGFRCCCTSYGGLNTSGADPFALRRIPISPWYATPHQFGLDVAFRRTLIA